MKQTAHVATNFLNLDDPNAALGAVNAFSDLGRYTNKGRTLYVFTLDEAR
jgi:hypothetical protein